jgi:hypothetical protein
MLRQEPGSKVRRTGPPGDAGFRSPSGIVTESSTTCRFDGAELGEKSNRTGGLFLREVFFINDKWNAEKANQRIRMVLAEIDELGDKLSPARAEALLDEFEREIGGAFLRQDMAAVMANCEEYARRFRALAEEED